MTMSTSIRNYTVFIFTILSFITLPFIAEARGSFGGRGGGRSFGSRSFGGFRSNSSSRSFGGNRSFGSGRSFSSNRFRPINSAKDYRSRYGIPRKTTAMNIGNNGSNRNYQVHSYGGIGDGFMAGYLMGSIPWYWHMPFHPAFYYSRPVVVQGANGNQEVYPGTFSIGSFLLGLLLVGGFGFVLYALFKKRKPIQSQYSSFG